MIPTGLRKQGRCQNMLKLAAFLTLVSTVYCGMAEMVQTPAQDRLFESLLSPFTGWTAPTQRPYNIPDVAGFGMYPLWKFHKFDGLSLRPVPYGLDIGSGLPPVPQSPSQPQGYPGSPASAVPCNGGACRGTNYSPPPTSPLSGYESPSYGSAAAAPPQTYSSSSQAPTQYGNNPQAPSYASPPQTPSYTSAPQAPSYGSTPQAPSYGSTQQAPSYGSAPPASSYNAPQAPQMISYQPVSQPQQYSQAPASSYGSNTPAISVSFNSVPQGAPQGYGDMSAPGGYGGSSPGGYGESAPSGYGGVANTPSFVLPYSQVSNGGYDGGNQYGANGGNMYSAPAQDYGSYGSGSFQIPSYAALENPMSVSYPSMQESKPMDYSSGYAGGFLKRSSTQESEKDIPSVKGTVTDDNS